MSSNKSERRSSHLNTVLNIELCSNRLERLPVQRHWYSICDSLQTAHGTGAESPHRVPGRAGDCLSV
eukprot:4047084-Amphidinium_carterae.1